VHDVKRTFVCVEIPTAEQERIAALRHSFQGLSGIRWVQASLLHVTVRFLGNRDSEEIDAVKKAVDETAAKHRAFEMIVGWVGAFPNPRRPRVIWAGIAQGADRLQGAHADLEAALRARRFEREDAGEYTPHITLGRLRDRVDQAELEAAAATLQGLGQPDAPMNQPKARFLAAGLTIMHSRITSTGPRYTPAHVAPFQTVEGRR
jgi:2'-5' RNA ligase